MDVDDGVYLGWLKAAGYEAVVVIPDYCVFGAVASVADLPGFLHDLFGKLALTGS